ncbi:MAG: ATP-binding protein [Gemmatimonadaceae bacterium]
MTAGSNTDGGTNDVALESAADRELIAERRRAVITASDRLERVRATALLDTPAEQAFDRLTRLASKILKVPVSLVSLVDGDRDFWKSCIGVPEPFASAREIRLGPSFCQHAIMSAAPLVVNDAPLDPIFADFPAVKGMGVRAYLGIPLITSDGVALGSFCVLDTQPHEWTPEQIDILLDLSGTVMTEIELRAAITAAEDMTNQLHEQARELEHQAAELEQQVEESQAISEELEEANQQLTATALALDDRTREAEREHRRVASVLESMTDASFAVDSSWRATHVNAAFERMIGRDRGDLIGKDWWSEFPDATRTEVYHEYHRAMRKRVAVELLEYYPALNQWYQARAFPTDDGGLAVYLQNVTERRELEDARDTALAAAENANRAKSEFLASMSHELRTPLNAIGGYVQLIEMGLRGPVTAEQLSDLSRIQRSQKHLLGLINDVLNFAKLGAGQVEYHTERVPLDAALRDAESMILPQMRSKGLEYSYEACDTSLMALADRDKLQQIVLNLLSNAVKFTPEGGSVTVGCAADGDLVQVRVHDTGIGIPAEKLVNIFEPFVQVERKLSQPAAGVGLGLAISRDLAVGMGGDLRVESTSAGSTFTLTLPITA